ncbi:MAG: hypothetical protein K8R58_01935, partial [Bacteroidales bacterium]|nr:hypothetical protein [Bacteroidales bacterium]
MNKIQYYIIIFLILFGNLSFGQKFTEFSKDSESFISEMTNFFQKISIKKNKEKCEKLMETFSLEWTSGKFTNEMKEDIYNISNLMLKRRLKAYPHFFHYLSCMVSIVNFEQSLVRSCRAWNLCLDELVNIKHSSRPFTSFLDISYNLFSDNILYKSKATLWKSNNNDYYFEYDSVPRIVFPSLNLTCYANKDSSVIYNTKGVYYPLIYKWIGEGGKLTWKRAGFDENNVYAELYTYEIFLKFSKFSVEQVKFYHKGYFDKPLLGSLEEKVLANVTEKNASYPRFTSSYTHIKVDTLFKNIDFGGGIEMKGAKIIGSGDRENDAYLILRKDNKEFVRIKSNLFVIRKDRISSSRASITIYYEGDSIYHPGLQMKYMDDNKELSLIRTGKGLSKSPFFDSYHNIDIFCEAIYWKMNEPDIKFQMVKGISGLGRATFESTNYFAASRYFKLQGIDKINPLNLLKNYTEKYNIKEIYVRGLMEYMKKPKQQIIAMLITLANKGFLIYDTDDEKAIIKDRLYDYIDAFNRKIDYDVIQFNSETYGHNNASLSLDSFDLKLHGVPIVFLSDSQKVFIFPNNKELVLKKNRDFLFSGRVHAGLFDFYASNCYFNYDQFKLDMPTIDSMSFMVQSFTKDEYGQRHLERVKTVLSDLTGDLLIDEPNNKSGLKKYPRYPVFSSTKDAYVYYDKNTIQNGVYTRDKFYFYVYPFTIDSLDNFKTDVLHFNGYLASAGIFPDIEESLKVQPDYSLGFISSAPPQGYPIYGDKGTYFSKINLSHQGLRGNGSLEYLTSTSWSKDFLFFPDSCNAVAKSFVLREQLGAVEYPSVKGIQVYEHWMPYQDRMIISKIDFPFSMYDNQSELHGSLALSPTKLTGGGMMKFEEAEMDARLYKFKHHEFDSDTADFRLRTLDQTQLAFSTHNYQSHIDLKERQGVFKSNGGTSLVEFPVNQYICSMDEFDWYMDKAEIALGSSQKAEEMAAYDNLTLYELVDVDLSGSEFISVHPDQDSLRFYSTKAKFSLKDNVILAEDVKMIRVADAAIFPVDKKVTIRKDAQMKTLTNAKILANTVTKYHSIYNAAIKIKAKKNYTAIGAYDYIDETGYRQRIQLKKIVVDTTFQTYAIGYISDSLGFTLSNDFDFAGNIKLLANNEFLNFNGGFRIR